MGITTLRVVSCNDLPKWNGSQNQWKWKDHGSKKPVYRRIIYIKLEIAKLITTYDYKATRNSCSKLYDCEGKYFVPFIFTYGLTFLYL